MDDDTLICDVDFGDGDTVEVESCDLFDLTQIFHTYDVPGLYTASVTVTDKDGGSITDTKQFTVSKRRSLTTIFGDLDPPGGGEVVARARLTDLYRPARGTPLADKQAFRRQYDIPEDAVVLVTVARLFMLKGHDYIIESAQELAKRFSHVMWLFVGNGNLAGYIAYRPWECDVTEHIKPGRNSVEVTIIGTLRNTLGPHHNGDVLGSAWPSMFQKGPDTGPPPGKKYSTVGYGLFKPFELCQY